MANAGVLEISLLTNVAKLSRDMDEAKGAVGSAMASIEKSVALAKNALMGLAGGFSAMALVGKLVAVQREFDVLNSSLITVTGSSAKAAQAFAWIEKFAATTPYSLNEVTGAFVKMKSLGLDASEKALRSYGNTASAMGKGLNQMIEAVADASTGSFERLLEFGIKAKKEGDSVSLTFQGVTTKIGNNAEEISGYLRKIGDVNFGTAMELRAATLDGALSNLGDSWNKLFLTINQNQTGTLIADAVKLAADALTALTGSIDTIAAVFVTGAKIAAAYFALFVAAPVAFAAVSTAIMAVVDAAALYAFNVITGTAATVGFNTVLFGTSVAADLAAGSLTKIMLAANLLFAAFAGWQIGTLLREQFVEVRVAGLWMVGGLLKAWEGMKYGFETAINGMKSLFYGFVKGLGDVLQNIPGFATAGKILSDAGAENLKRIASDQAAAKAAYEGATAELEKSGLEMAAWELANDKAKTAVTGNTEATKAATKATEQSKEAKKASEEQQKLVNAGLALYNDLMAEQSGYSKTFTVDVTKLAAAYQASGMTADEYRAALDKIIANQPFSVELAKEQKKAFEDQAKATDKAAVAYGKYLDELAMRNADTDQIGIDYKADTKAMQDYASLESSLMGQSATAREDALAQYKAQLDLEVEIQKIRKAGGDEATIAANIAIVTASATSRAAVESQKKYVAEWNKTYDRISDGLVDALMKGGKEGAQGIRDLLVQEIFSKPFRMIVQALVQPVAQGLTSMVTGKNPDGTPASSGGFSFSSMSDSTFASMELNLNKAADWMMTSQSETLNSLGETLSANTSAVTQFAKTGANVLGYLDALNSASEGKWGAAIGQGIGTYFGGPIGGTIGKIVGSFVDDLAGGGGGPKTDTSYGNGATFGDTSKTGMAGKYVTSIETAWEEITKSLGLTAKLTASAFLSIDTIGDDLTNFNAAAKINGVTVSDRVARTGSMDAAQVGRTPEELQAALEAEVSYILFEALQASDIGDQALAYLTEVDAALASMASEGDRLQAVQIATSNVVVIHDFQEALKNLPFEYLTGLSFNAAKGLIEAAGGLDQLGASLGGFYNNFYTAEEKQAMLTTKTSESFAKLGMVMPAVDEGLKSWYRSEVERLGAMDLNIEANARAYTGAMALQNNVLGLSDGFDTAADAAASAAEKTAQAAQAMASAMAGLQSEIDQYRLNAGTTTTLALAQGQQGAAFDALVAGLGSGVPAGLTQANAEAYLTNTANAAKDPVTGLSDFERNLGEAGMKLASTFMAAVNNVDSIIAANTQANTQSYNTQSYSEPEPPKVDTSYADALVGLAKDTASFIQQIADIGKEPYELALSKISQAAADKLTELNKLSETDTVATEAARAAARAKVQEQYSDILKPFDSATMGNYRPQTLSEIVRMQNSSSTRQSIGYGNITLTPEQLAMAAEWDNYTAAMTAAGLVTIDNTGKVKEWTDAQYQLLAATELSKAKTTLKGQTDTGLNLEVARATAMGDTAGAAALQRDIDLKDVVAQSLAATTRLSVEGLTELEKEYLQNTISVNNATIAKYDENKAYAATTASMTAFKSSLEGLQAESRNLDIELARAQGNTELADGMVLADAIAAAIKGVTDPIEKATLEAAVRLNAGKQKELDIQKEKNGLLDELNSLTDTNVEALTRQRNALNASNQAIFDQVQAQKSINGLREAFKTPDTTAEAMTKISAARFKVTGLDSEGIAAYVNAELDKVEKNAANWITLTDGTKVLTAAAQTTVNSLNDVKDSLLLVGSAADASNALIKTITDQTTEAIATNGMTALQKKLWDIDQQTAAWVKTLTENGMSIAAANAAVKDYSATFKSAAIAADATANLNDKLSMLAEIASLTKDYAGAASILEQQHAIALKAVAPELQNVTRLLWATQSAAAALSRYTTANDAVTAIQENATSQYITAKEKEANAVNKVTDLIRASVDSLNKLGKTLQDFVSENMTAAKPTAMFDSLLQKSLAGDQDAMGKLTSAASTAITATADASATSSDANLEKAKILAGVLSVAAKALAEKLPEGVPPNEDAAVTAKDELAAAVLELAEAKRVALAVEAPLVSQISDLIAKYTEAKAERDAAKIALDAANAVLEAIKINTGDTATNVANQKWIIDAAAVEAKLAIEAAINTTVTAVSMTEEIKSLVLGTSADLSRLVTVTVSSTVLSEELKTLVLGTITSLAKTLGVTVSSTVLSEELKTLVLGTTASLAKTLGVTVSSTVLSDELKTLVLGTTASLAKTLGVTINSTSLTPALQALAVGTVGTLTKYVNAVISSNALTDPLKKMGLETVGVFNKSINAIITNNTLPADLVALGLNVFGASSKAITAIVSSSISDTNMVKVLSGATNLATTITSVLSSSIPYTQKALLTNAVASANMGVNLSASLGSALTADQISILNATNQSVYKIVDESLSLGYVTADQISILNKANESVSKVVEETVTGGTLTADQRAILNAITGTTSSNLTLGGSVTFDPSATELSLFKGIASGIFLINDQLEDMYNYGLGPLLSVMTQYTGKASNYTILPKTLTKEQSEQILTNGRTALGFASGGAFVNGVQAFAAGDSFTNSIVSRPTNFNMGLMGEAGPEAIMPLHRGADGSLGVSAANMPAPIMPILTNYGRGQDNSALVAEIKALRQENKAQATAMVQMQLRMAKIVERWDGAGMPEQRGVA